jgi:hypothetical protein
LQRGCREVDTKGVRLTLWCSSWEWVIVLVGMELLIFYGHLVAVTLGEQSAYNWLILTEGSDWMAGST